MSESGRPPRRRFFAAAAIFYLILAVAGLLGLGLERGSLGSGVWFESERWPLDLAVGAGLGVLLLASWALAVRWFAGARRVEDELAALLSELTLGETLALALISALAEETAFRGALQAWLGWPAAALLFGLAHLGPGRHYRWWTAWALVAGALLGLLVAGQGSLGGAVVAHLVVNAVQLARLGRRAVPG